MCIFCTAFCTSQCTVGLHVSVFYAGYSGWYYTTMSRVFLVLSQLRCPCTACMSFILLRGGTLGADSEVYASCYEV